MAREVTGKTRIEKIEFYEAHLQPWSDNMAVIGLDPGMVGSISALTAGARAAHGAALSARNASQAATQAFHDATAQMASYGSSLIATIRAKAQTSNDPLVYRLAEIPPPAAPSPAGPPTDAKNLRATGQNDGSILLAWDGTVSNGQFFSVRRRLSGSPGWTNLGSVRVKSFVDPSVPAGTVAVEYQVFALRGARMSHGSEPLVVYFGSVRQAA